MHYEVNILRPCRSLSDATFIVYLGTHNSDSGNATYNRVRYVWNSKMVLLFLKCEIEPSLHSLNIWRHRQNEEQQKDLGASCALPAYEGMYLSTLLCTWYVRTILYTYLGSTYSTHPPGALGPGTWDLWPTYSVCPVACALAPQPGSCPGGQGGSYAGTCKVPRGTPAHRCPPNPPVHRDLGKG